MSRTKQSAFEAMEAYKAGLDPSLVKMTRDPDEAEEDMNGRRADWAEDALVHFMFTTGTDGGDAIADLICNIQHWCDRNGVNFDHELYRAQDMYADEAVSVEEPMITAMKEVKRKEAK